MIDYRIGDSRAVTAQIPDGSVDLIAWLERCLAVMALDPDTAGDYANAPVGMPAGPKRPEYGPGHYDLACQICEATWVGVPGDPCWWCETAAQRQIDHQIDLLLKVPDVDPDDANYDNRMRGWVARMKVGVEAGLITKQQAESAFRRTQRKTAA